MYPNIYLEKILSRVIEIWMKNHLESDNIYNIVNLQCPFLKKEKGDNLKC